MDDKVRINLVSHNINGFNSSESFLNMVCEDDHNSILCVQEHWLRPAYKKLKSVNQLRTVHECFDGYGVSASIPLLIGGVTVKDVVLTQQLLKL